MIIIKTCDIKDQTNYSDCDPGAKLRVFLNLQEYIFSDSISKPEAGKRYVKALATFPEEVSLPALLTAVYITFIIIVYEIQR